MSLLGLVLAVGVGVTLGFLGGGGSILTVPLLVYVFGLEPKAAIANSLLIVSIASVSGAIQHARAGNVQLRTASLFGAAGVFGAYSGGRLAAWLQGELLLLLFAVVMIGAAFAMWRGRREAPPASSEVSAWKLVLQGAVVGTFTGLVGAGGGFLIVPALVLWAGLSMPAAVGTSLIIIVANSLAGFSGYAAHVSADWLLVASVSGAAVVGSIGGSALARQVAPGSARRAFAGFVFLMGAMILVREGQLVAQMTQDALPATISQLLFVVLMAAAGAAAGRASRAVRDERATDLRFDGGAGI